MGQGQQRPVPIKPPLNIDPIFVDVSLPVPWTLLWTSPEVVFSLVSVISSFLLLVMYSSDTPVLGRNGLLAMGSLEDLEFLQGREAEAAPTAAPTVSADLLLLIVTLMSTSCFLKACCRVFLKAQRQLEEKQLEEKLAIRRDPAKRAAQLAEEAEKEVKLKNLEAENKERLAKDLPPKRQIVKVPKIHGVELFTNVVVAMSVSVCIAVVALIQTQRGNQMRGFGAVLILALLCAGIVIPTACHGLLSMQHVCGLSDVCCVLSILYLVYQSVSTQRG